MNKDEIKARIEACENELRTLRHEIDKPEFEIDWNSKIGALVYVSNGKEKPCKVHPFSILIEYNAKAEYPFITASGPWKYASLAYIDFVPNWIPWNGGECPVSEWTAVMVKFRDGEIITSSNGPIFRWDHIGTYGDIIGYVIIKP